MLKENSHTVQDETDQSIQLMTREYIVGTTSIGKKDTFVTIKDPKTFQVLVRMKNPVVPIVRRSNKNKRWIDLEENVMKNEQPYFGLLFPPDFEEK